MNSRNVCDAMKKLKKEQDIIARAHKEFEFIFISKDTDTIPFMLFHNEKSEPFMAYYKMIATPYFRLEELLDNCFAELTLLEAIDMEGNTAFSTNDFYSLRKTEGRIIVNLQSFHIINSTAPELVNRPLPIIENK